MSDLVNISVPDALLTALLGYGVVFLGLVLLMAVVLVMGRIMARTPASAAPADAAAPETPAAPAEKAPGAAGELKLYNTDPRDAAMVMAIVADATGIPLNQLRFKSIKEVKEP